jgi:hypothetical protein
MGLASEANYLEKEWQSIADLLKIKEEYFGYYTFEYETLVNELLEDMLIEAAPIKFYDVDLSANDIDFQNFNYIHLLNLAWKKFIENENLYLDWEKSVFINLGGKKE